MPLEKRTISGFIRDIEDKIENNNINEAVNIAASGLSLFPKSRDIFIPIINYFESAKSDTCQVNLLKNIALNNLNIFMKMRICMCFLRADLPNICREYLIDTLGAASADDIALIDSSVVANILEYLEKAIGAPVDLNDSHDILQSISPDLRLKRFLREILGPEALIAADAPKTILRSEINDRIVLKYFANFPKHPARLKNIQNDSEGVDLITINNSYIYVHERGFTMLNDKLIPFDFSFPYVTPQFLSRIHKSEVIEKHERIFFCGDRFTPKNYCQWTTDYLPRILLAKEVLGDIPILIPKFDAKRFQLEMLKYFGVSEGVVKPMKPGLHFSSEVSLFDISAHKFRRYFQAGNKQLAEVVLQKIPKAATRSNLCVWLARGNTPLRQIENNKEVEAFVISRGFTVLDLGALSFGEQVDVMSRASHIAGMHGAAFTNVIFAKPGTRILECFPGDYGTPAFAILSAIREHAYLPWIVTEPNPRNVLGRDRQTADVIVDLEALGRGLDQLLCPLPNF